MKIGFVDNSLWGQLNFRGDIIRKIKENGHEVVIISPNDLKYEMLIDLQYYDLKIDRKSKNILKDIVFLYKLNKIYKKEKFDIVFHYTIKPNIYGSIAAKINKQKSINIIPGLGYSFGKNNFLEKVIKRLYKFSLRYSKEVWFLNTEDKEYFLKNNLLNDRVKIKVLPGEGINLEKFKPVKLKKENTGEFIFLMVTRLLWEKGFEEYVKAAEILLKKYKNIKFNVLGIIDKGNPKAVPEEEVNYYHSKNIINYLGETNKVEEIIDMCDCLVLPSFYREGIPRTLMEGAAMEKPLITTNNIGCKEVVENNRNGYICEIKNAHDLAEKMEKMILLSEKERQNFGKYSRKKMEKEFSNEIILKEYMNTISLYKTEG